MSLSTINPVKRLEYFLQDIAEGKATATKTPVIRLEEFLRRIAAKEADQDAALSDVGGFTHSYTKSVSLNTALTTPISPITVTEASLAGGITAFRTAWAASATSEDIVKLFINRLALYFSGHRLTLVGNTVNLNASIVVLGTIITLLSSNGDTAIVKINATVRKTDASDFITFTATAVDGNNSNIDIATTYTLPLTVLIGG